MDNHPKHIGIWYNKGFNVDHPRMIQYDLMLNHNMKVSKHISTPNHWVFPLIIPAFGWFWGIIVPSLHPDTRKPSSLGNRCHQPSQPSSFSGSSISRSACANFGCGRRWSRSDCNELGWDLQTDFCSDLQSSFWKKTSKIWRKSNGAPICFSYLGTGRCFASWLYPLGQSKRTPPVGRCLNG